MADASMLAPLTFVWRAWRDVPSRYYGYTLAIGLVFGAIGGVGAALFELPRAAPWVSFVNFLVPFTIHAMFLLLCIAIADRVPVRHVRWWPYALAGIVGAAASPGDPLLEWLSGASAEPAPQRTAFQTFSLLWINFGRDACISVLAAFGYMYLREAQRRADALRAAQVARARLARRNREETLRAMQARIEPQFLFDTLRAIEREYERDAGHAERTLDDLIVFLRKALPGLGDPSSTLATELDLVRAWLDVMKARSHGRIQYAIAAPGDAERLRLSPMLLLPIVEHIGTAGGPDRGKLVEVAATVDGARVRIAFTDTVPDAGRDADALVRTLTERLRSLYGDAASISATRDASTLRITVEVPHERTDRDHR